MKLHPYNTKKVLYEISIRVDLSFLIYSDPRALTTPHGKSPIVIGQIY